MKPIMSRPASISPAAFTLVEVLVTIAIVGVLTSLLIPSVRDSIDRTNVSKCTAQMRQLGQILHAYAQDHELTFPVTSAPPDGLSWSHLLVREGYVTDTRIYKCPADSLNKVKNVDQSGQPEARSYSLCVEAMSGGLPSGLGTATRLTVVQSPSKQFMMTEWHSPDNNWYWGSYAGAQWDIISPQSISPSHGRDGRRNFLFMDGHVEIILPGRAKDQYSGWLLNDVRD